MSDLIDRQETIKQFCKQDCGCDPRDCPGKTCYEVEIIESVPTHTTPSNTLDALDCVSREDLTKGIEAYFGDLPIAVHYDMLALAQKLPSVQPTTLTEDDKETIRIHLSAFKEKLCNQHRWNEAKEYEELISRLLSTPSVQPRKGKISYTKSCEELWGQSSICSLCGCSWQIAEDGNDNFCPNCGCRMEEGDAE